MPFMVIYRTSDGSSKYEQVDAIDEAALLVERLRNSDGIDEIRIYRMEEISFAFRPYYKVELGLPDRQTPAPVGELVGGTTVVEAPAAPVPSAPTLTRRVVERREAVPELDGQPADEAPSPAPVMAPPAAGSDLLAEGAGPNGPRRGLFGR